MPTHTSVGLPVRQTTKRLSLDWAIRFDRARRIGALVFGALVAIAVVIAVVRGTAPPVDQQLPMASPSDSSSAAVATNSGPVGSGSAEGSGSDKVVVHVAGAVNTPGVVELSAGARTTDAITAAGGPTANADLAQLNLAETLIDGVRILVPMIGETAPGSEAASSAGGLVNLNTATQAELEELPGVGPSTAEAIIEHRKANGAFGSVDDLLDVRGIGPAKLDAMRDLLRV